LSARDLAVVALLVLGVGITLLSCVGVLVMRNPYDRLHYTAPAAVLAPVAIAAAVALSQITVGAVALPLMILLALAKVRALEGSRRRDDDR
jgi:multisubunit Na+/H+ antiporter MnhG subunit